MADGDIELTNIGNNQAVDYKENGELGEKQSSGQDASGEVREQFTGKEKKENLFKKRKTFGPLIYSIELHSGGLELRATELQLLDYHDWFDPSG